MVNKELNYILKCLEQDRASYAGYLFSYKHALKFLRKKMQKDLVEFTYTYKSDRQQKIELLNAATHARKILAQNSKSLEWLLNISKL